MYFNLKLQHLVFVEDKQRQAKTKGKKPTFWSHRDAIGNTNVGFLLVFAYFTIFDKINFRINLFLTNSLIYNK